MMKLLRNGQVVGPLAWDTEAERLHYPKDTPAPREFLEWLKDVLPPLLKRLVGCRKLHNVSFRNTADPDGWGFRFEPPPEKKLQ